MDVSVIIINYKSCALVMQCIESIVRETDAGTYEIIVIDNDSQDGAREKISAVFPAVRWIDMGYNAGFSRANNAGMRIAGGRYHLILNADTIITDRAITKSIALLKNYPDAIGCGVQLLNTDGTTQISGAHFVTGGLNTLLPLPYLGRLVRYLGYRFKARVPSIQEVKDSQEVDWVVGAYMLIDSEAAGRAGLFDEDFFMYAEEIEWCARLRRQGKLVLFSEPRVVHIGGGTSSDYYDTEVSENGKNLWNRKGRQVMVSNMLRIRKQFGIFWFLLILTAYLFTIPLFAGGLLLEKLTGGSRYKYRWKDVKGYAANMLVLLRYAPRMLLNKPYFYKVA